MDCRAHSGREPGTLYTRAVARHLPVRTSVRLRVNDRERDDEIEDDVVPEPSDLISKDDVFPEDPVEVGDPEDDGSENPSGLHQLLAAVPGPLIAAATFVPTFLVIFFGLSYIVGAVLGTGATASGPSPSGPMAGGARWTPPSSMSEALRDPFATSRVFEPPTPKASDPREVTGSSGAPEPVPAPSAPPSTSPSTSETPASAIESSRPTLPPARSPATPPAIPPAQPRPAIVPAPESRVGRAAEPPRQPQAAVLNTTPERTPAAQTTPAVDTRKGAGEWTPAAAFADRDAATRLASSIQQQGYPVEIRQEASSSRPWVVWIGAQPRAGERRR